ncbi:aspartyl-phosphate phosphatase Spo0E family protein [Candidatus Soleaferrea massiliensis]|uniref:aspartyl-phosphate phosphatase Spo0E family protein n=1 Tax=Candidatus Soleaferrea massiliensis TaxID=1470354 RepID=UPI00058DE1A4|nr:aspartyl-phosphate phosphatase Spo0E family protein [Candidatus Soleaferrea massiliensis]
MDWSQLDKDIFVLRNQLHQLIESQADYKKILQVSRQLDELINQFELYDAENEEDSEYLRLQNRESNGSRQ